MRRVSSRRILFAVDSPSLGPAALAKVASLALALDAEVELFHCIYDAQITRPGRFATRGAQEDIHGLITQRRSQLEHAAEGLRSRGARARTSVRWDYPPHEGIVRQVLRYKPSLLIAHSVRKTRMARALFTQTDYKLIETCPCPVLLIKTHRNYSQPLLIAAVDPEHAHGKPAALDEAILDWTIMFHDALGARVRVIHARTPWEEAVRAQPDLGNVPEVERNDVYSAYCDTIDSEVRALARRYGIPDEQVRCMEGHPTEVLARSVTGETADIVVIGAATRSWLKRTLIGHTAERILDALDCDLLVVKPPGFRSSVSAQSTHHVDRSATLRSKSVW